MFFNSEQTWQSIQQLPQSQPHPPVLERAAVGFVEGYLAAKILKRVVPLPKPWQGR